MQSLNLKEAFICADVKYDGAIMITASHLPFNRNGFKFFDNKAGFEKKEITDLLSRAAEDAAQGSLAEEASFPRDRGQAESSAVQALESSFNAEASLIQKVFPEDSTSTLLTHAPGTEACSKKGEA